MSMLYTNMTFLDPDSTEDMTIWSMPRGNKNVWTPGGSEHAQNPSPQAKVTRSPTKVPQSHGIDETVSA